MSLLESPILEFTELIYRLLKRMSIAVTPDGEINIKLEPVRERKGKINERIAKIDSARANLLEGLKAIDELKEAAETNKRDAEIALHQLEQLEESKAGLQKELESIKNIVKSDVNTFREVAGIPSQAAIRRERIIGFISGVVASVVASGIVWLIVWLVKLFII